MAYLGPTSKSSASTSSSSLLARSATREDDLHANNNAATFSACFMWMDDNFRLYEWMAYHYYMLHLRYVVNHKPRPNPCWTCGETGSASSSGRTRPTSPMPRTKSTRKRSHPSGQPRHCGETEGGRVPQAANRRTKPGQPFRTTTSSWCRQAPPTHRRRTSSGDNRACCCSRSFSSARPSATIPTFGSDTLRVIPSHSSRSGTCGSRPGRASLFLAS
jgi:hypothetical protein